MELPSILRLRPRLQTYAWGDARFLPELLDLSDAAPPLTESSAGVAAAPRQKTSATLPEGPYAEAWFGAHPNAPALVGEERVPLDALLAAYPQRMLGAELGARYGGMPYLLKLLAAARPLSIQVHPSREQAELGFAREEGAGIDRRAAHRCYRDPNHKPELLVALTDFHALCGFRQGEDLAAALQRGRELSELVPGPTPAGPQELAAFLQAYFTLPPKVVAPALQALIKRLQAEAADLPFATHTPEHWALVAARELYAHREPDRGLLFVFLLSYRRLAKGEGLFLPAGLPHAYLRGAGVELMASSDNVLRAGLTQKHIDPAELLRIVCFDAAAPSILHPVQTPGIGELRYLTPAAEFALRRLVLEDGQSHRWRGHGPQTLLSLCQDANARLRVSCAGETMELACGQACLLPHDRLVEVCAAGPIDAFVADVPPAEDAGVPSQWACLATQRSAAVEHKSKTGVTGTGTDDAHFVAAVRRNIEVSERILREGGSPEIIGTVCGSAGAKRFWQQKLDEARSCLAARHAVSFHEDLPVNQAFGLLLLWQRLQQDCAASRTPGAGALVAFVFGEGSRASPMTEAECGQKPAISSFVRSGGRWLSTVELALRSFLPVEAFLRRSGFDGLVVKWGDEVQIPTRDLSGRDRRFAEADVVRFVSLQAMTEDDARNKDWVGVDQAGQVTAFIPRRPLAEMAALADRGLLQRQGDRLFGGINLGSIAVSRALLDCLLEEFRAEVNDPNADRRKRPDLDPQLFTALTIARLPDPTARAAAWRRACAESPAIDRLAIDLPQVLDRLRSALDRFEAQHGRPPRLVALDCGDQYWGDVGQHKAMHALFMALAGNNATAEIARILAGIDVPADAQGNRLLGQTRLGPHVRVRNSVLIDAHIEAGDIEGCVLLGTQAGRLDARHAFDVQSTACALRLEPRAGAYKVVSEKPVAAAPGERLASVFDGVGEPLLLRVHESIDLRDRARHYDRPLSGNPCSFREAHARVVQADPRAIEAQRQLRRLQVGRLFSRAEV